MTVPQVLMVHQVKLEHQDPQVQLVLDLPEPQVQMEALDKLDQ